MRIIDAQTVSLDVQWTEPTLNSDGSALVDLAYSSVYYSTLNGPLVVGAKLPATVVTGGGTIQTTLIVPAPAGAVTPFKFQVSATDLSGNESVKTDAVFFTIERLAPSAPLGFIVG